MSRRLLIAIPFFWLLIFFLAPFALVLKISLSDAAVASPPYLPHLGFESWEDIVGFVAALDFESFDWVLSDDLYIKSFFASLRIATISTILCLIFGYLFAYGMARAPRHWQKTLLLLVILPFWTSFLIRVYAWIALLKNQGLINHLLMSMGLIDEPLTLLNTNFAVYVGIVYSYSTLMIFPIYASLLRLDKSLLEAARDLGCSRFSAFWQVTFPLSLPGVLAGCFLVFIPAMGEFVIPDILGGTRTLMIGRTIWLEFFNNSDWPIASAVAVLLLIVLIGPIVLFQKHQERHMGRI